MAATSSNPDKEVRSALDLLDRLLERAGADWGMTLRYLTLIVVPITVVVIAVVIMSIAAGSRAILTALSGGVALYEMNRRRMRPRGLARRSDE